MCATATFRPPRRSDRSPPSQGTHRPVIRLSVVHDSPGRASANRGPTLEERETRMKSKAAVLTEVNKPWEIMEVDVRDPKEGEVLIRYVAAGLCHSDMHLMTGDLPVPLPYIGGHEGAGVIEAVGPGSPRRSPRATTSSARSSRPAATAAGARPAARACATWARRSSSATCPTATYRVLGRRRRRRGDVHARHLLAVRDDQRGVGRQGRRRPAARGRGAVRLRRADGLGLGRQHRQRPDRRHGRHLSASAGSAPTPCRAPRTPARPGSSPSTRIAVQARVRAGDGRHPHRRRPPRRRTSWPARTRPAAPMSRS